MDHRFLGRTGLRIAPLVLGTDNILNPTPEDQSIRMIHAALDAGINMIDTSNSYGAARFDGRGFSQFRLLDGDAVAGFLKAIFPYVHLQIIPKTIFDRLLLYCSHLWGWLINLFWLFVRCIDRNLCVELVDVQSECENKRSSVN